MYYINSNIFETKTIRRKMMENRNTYIFISTDAELNFLSIHTETKIVYRIL